MVRPRPGGTPPPPRTSPSIQVFLDFDGTLVGPNTAIELVSHFCPDGERLAHEIDLALHARQITLREAWQRQVALLPFDRMDEMTAFLRESISLRPGARELVHLLSEHNVPAAILSGGLDAFIRPILARERLDLPVLSDSVTFAPDGSPLVVYPFGHPTCRLCGVCKAAAVQRPDPAGARSIFVGDGSTDRFAAEMADVVFARRRLRDYCVEHQIRFFPFEDLQPVTERLRTWLEGIEPMPAPRRLGRRESPCPISQAAAGQDPLPPGADSAFRGL